MHFAVICALLLCSTAVFADYDDYIPCSTDLDCKYDECCVLAFTGDQNVCREIGDDVMDPCGGRYFCPVCARNLNCVAVPAANEVNDWPHPANGTCERIGRPARPRP